MIFLYILLYFLIGFALGTLTVKYNLKMNKFDYEPLSFGFVLLAWPVALIGWIAWLGIGLCEKYEEWLRKK